MYYFFHVKSFWRIALPFALLLQFPLCASVAQQRAAVYWGFEGWYGHDCGSLSYVDEQGVLHEDVLRNAVNGDMTPGTTLQFATHFGGKIYAVSKQKYGDAENRLIRIDPSTWTIERMGGEGFEEMDPDLQMFHFLGVSDRVAFLSTSSDELYKINLEDLSAELVDDDGWLSADVEGIGTMVLYRGRIVAEVYTSTESELWVLRVEGGAVETKFLTEGLTSPIVTRDGRLLAVLLQGKKGRKKVAASLVELDIDDVSAEPREVLKFEKAMRPLVKSMWSPSAMFASPIADRVFWSVSRGSRGAKSIAMLDLNVEPLHPIIVYSGEDGFYGVARENPHDGSIWVNCNGDYSPADRLMRLVPYGEEYGAEAQYISNIQYGFASLPFFEDRHAARVKVSSRAIRCGQGDTIDLCDHVEDRDGFSANVLFSELRVEGEGWNFTLDKNHLLRVKAVGEGCARVRLKAFSSGRSSELTFRLGDSLCTADAISLGKGESRLLLGVAVMPNPCADWVQLRGVQGLEEWAVYTQHGNLVAKGRGDGGDRLNISTFAWASGLYFVRLKASDGVRTLVVVKE